VVAGTVRKGQTLIGSRVTAALPFPPACSWTSNVYLLRYPAARPIAEPGIHCSKAARRVRHITSHILRLALLRIFADADIGAGDRLDFTQISARWPQTGLRNSDLRDAVRELLDSGDLVGSGHSETLSLALSPAARRGLAEPYGELHMASFDDEATLFMARHRHRDERAPQQRQRAEDQGLPVSA